LPIVEMLDKFKILMQSEETDSSEVDDITIVGLEIL
jgi:hypothetical protein